MEETTIRAFVGLPVTATPPLRQAIDRLTSVGDSVRPVAVGQLDLTVRFLGNIDPALAPRIAVAMDQSLSGVAPANVVLRGIGVFPSARHPNVIWTALDGAETFAPAVSRFNQRLLALGLPPPDRDDWTPHLTLARVKARPPVELWEWLEKHRHATFGDCRIEDAHLIRSVTSPAGPAYTTLFRTRLGGSSPG